MRNFIFFLAGRSGAGKSTLFRSLQGEIFPENVKVSFVKEVKMRPVRTNETTEQDSVFMLPTEFNQWKESDRCAVTITFPTVYGDWEYGLPSTILETLDDEADPNCIANATFVTAGIAFYPEIRKLVKKHNEEYKDVEDEQIHLEMIYLYVDEDTLLQRLIAREMKNTKKPDFAEVVRRHQAETDPPMNEPICPEIHGSIYRHMDQYVDTIDDIIRIMDKLRGCGVCSSVVQGYQNKLTHELEEELLYSTGMLNHDYPWCTIKYRRNQNDESIATVTKLLLHMVMQTVFGEIKGDSVRKYYQTKKE